MSFEPFIKSSSILSKSTQSPTTNQTPKIVNKHLKIIEKQLNDLEELQKKICQFQQETNDQTLRDDCYELQKFCSKLEYLIQFDLKEKKNSTNFSSSTALTNVSSKEYWTFFVDILKEGRGGFQDAINYVKNLNEIKTNLGRGRAFIRFCLQYHRLADAIQQLCMDDKLIVQWYFDKSVWFNQNHKDKIIQLLYDLNDVNFELISKYNYELDTTWPVVQSNLNSIGSNLLNSRTRTYSMTSFISINTDHSKDQNDINNSTQLLSSTPLEMENDVFASMSLNRSKLALKSDDTTTPESTPHHLNTVNITNTDLQNNSTELLTQSVYYDVQNNLNNQNNTNNIDQILKTTTESSETIHKLTEQLDILNKQLNFKTTQYNELNACLIKQTAFCENLTELLKKSEQKNTDLNQTILKNNETIESLNKNLEQLKSDLNDKKLEQDSLVKETLTQTDSIKTLKQMCKDQENTINQLKNDLTLLREERETETETFSTQTKRSQVSLQLKEEENYLLNDQIQKLSKSLDEERKTNEYLTKELNECKTYYKNLTDKNKELINQLEADNNEIKKRLVKLIKEKAELWQKADNLEYENLLKTNAMWVDDANVSNCMSCNAGFSILLRKHHCRICLKIFCYYCCNNWIEYNNSKLRVCTKCFETKENLSKLKNEQTTIEAIKAASTIVNSSSNSGDRNSSFSDTKSLKMDEVNINGEVENNDDEEDDDDDPDINFEVRAEKLIAAINSNHPSSSEDNGELTSIYDSKASSSSGSNFQNQIKTKETNKEVTNKNDENNLIVEEIQKVSIEHENNIEPTAITTNNSKNSDDDLVVRKKVKLKKKKSLNDIKQLDQQKSSTSTTPVQSSSHSYNPFLEDLDDQEAFSIVSQEEINRATKTNKKKDVYTARNPFEDD